jgi:hypothetical protein
MGERYQNNKTYIIGKSNTGKPYYYGLGLKNIEKLEKLA